MQQTLISAPYPPSVCDLCLVDDLPPVAPRDAAEGVDVVAHHATELDGRAGLVVLLTDGDVVFVQKED